MKRVIYILLCLVFVGVSCKKQDVLQRNNDSNFSKKGSSIVDTDDQDDNGSSGIVDTDDEDDNSSSKKIKIGSKR